MVRWRQQAIALPSHDHGRWDERTMPKYLYRQRSSSALRVAIEDLVMITSRRQAVVRLGMIGRNGSDLLQHLNHFLRIHRWHFSISGLFDQNLRGGSFRQDDAFGGPEHPIFIHRL